MSDPHIEQTFEPNFGRMEFHSEKFANSEEDDIVVKTPVDSEGIDRAFAAFMDGVPIKDILPSEHELQEQKTP